MSLCMAALSKKAPVSGGFESARAIVFQPAPIRENPAVWTGFFNVPSPAFPQGDGPMSDLRTSDLQASDLRPRLRGLWLPLITPFRDGVLDEASLRRLVRHYIALPVDGLVLAATTGESLTLSPSKPNGWFSRCATKPAKTKNLPVLLGLSGSNTSALLDTLDANRLMADRRLSDFLPVLFAAVAAGAGASLPRARRSRQPSGSALQHSLPDRRQSRQRGDAAPGLPSQYRRTEGLLRRPQPVARPVAPALRRTSPC